MTMLTCTTACSPRRLARARWLVRAVAISALCLLLPGAVVVAAESASSASAGKSAKPKGKGKSRSKAKGKTKGTAATLSQMLTDKSSLVQDCAVQNALDKGSGRVDIATKVTINNRGQVISINTSVTLDKGEGGPKVKDCIEALVRAISFPPSEAPMITIERNWTISG